MLFLPSFQVAYDELTDTAATQRAQFELRLQNQLTQAATDASDAKALATSNAVSAHALAANDAAVMKVPVWMTSCLAWLSCVLIDRANSGSPSGTFFFSDYSSIVIYSI